MTHPTETTSLPDDVVKGAARILEELVADLENYASAERDRSANALRLLLSTLDARGVEIERLRGALGHISRMTTMPDDKANTFTLMMAHKLARTALSSEGGGREEVSSARELHQPTVADPQEAGPQAQQGGG